MPNITVTANGNAIDMEALRLKNEKSVAVGNMKVNARGDLIDDMNNVIDAKTRQVNRQYNKQIQDKK